MALNYIKEYHSDREIPMKKQNKITTQTEEKPQRTRHYFFLNPYNDCAFTKCPKCDNKTKTRKFPLVIHIEPHQLFVLNKTCKYCEKCDLIIGKQSDIEALMAASIENRDPSIIGNKYLVFGTLDRNDWETYSKTPTNPNTAIDQVYVFKDVLKFELQSPGWYKDED